MTWSALGPVERRDLVRQRYSEGWTPRQIADRYRTTRSAVIGCAWKWNITQANAAVWTEEKAAARREAVSSYHVDYRLANPRRSKRRKKHRPRMQINATDPATRAALSKLNQFPYHLSYIAEVMGVTYATMNNWWSGRHPMSKLSLSLVDETVRRLSS